MLFLESSRASFTPHCLDYGFVGLGVEPSPILEGLDENVARIDQALMKEQSRNDGVTNGYPARRQTSPRMTTADDGLHQLDHSPAKEQG